MMASVAGLYIAAERKAPMQSKHFVIVRANQGIVGDRHFDETGVTDHRFITVFSEEDLVAANSLLEKGFRPFETRRNIMVRGMHLNGMIGRTFRFGQVPVMGMELCTPCRRPSQLANKSGYETAFVGRAGLRVNVLRDGVINLHDMIVT